MLVSLNDRAIDIINGPVHFTSGIGLLLNALKEVLPDASFAPAIETTGYGAPGAIAFEQITPGGTGTQNLQHAVEGASAVRSGPTGFRFLRGSNGRSRSHCVLVNRLLSYTLKCDEIALEESRNLHE
jgi:hypothetical protein